MIPPAVDQVSESDYQVWTEKKRIRSNAIRNVGVPLAISFALGMALNEYIGRGYPEKPACAEVHERAQTSLYYLTQVPEEFQTTKVKESISELGAQIANPPKEYSVYLEAVNAAEHRRNTLRFPAFGISIIPVVYALLVGCPRDRKLRRRIRELEVRKDTSMALEELAEYEKGILEIARKP